MQRTPLAIFARAARRSALPPLRQAAAIRNYSDAAQQEPAAAQAAPAEKSEIEKKLADLEEQVKELNKQIKYQQADYQTLSRRGNEEKTKASQFAISKFASSLLQTSDILSQALSHVPQPIDASAQPALKSLFDGVSLTNKTLVKTLAEYGVEKFDSLGERFDPNRHEALYQVPKAALGGKKGPKGEELEEGTVMDVSVEGWQIKDRVLRPAQVGVVQAE